MTRLLTLAARNLIRHRTRTLLTAAAIAFGLALMMMTITLQFGQYKAMLDQGVSSLAGHVVVEHPDYQAKAEPELVVLNASAHMAAIRTALPEVIIAPRIQLGGLLSSPTNSVAIGLRGVDPAASRALLDLDEKIVEGAWLADDDTRGILIGVSMAKRLGVGIGEKVVFMGPGEDGETSTRLFRIAGIFKSGGAELDAFVGLTSLVGAQELLGRGDAVHQITIHLADGRKSEAAAAAVKQVVPPDLAVMTWRKALPELVAMIDIDRYSADLMMAVIGLIVAMGVLNTVLMSVLERTKEFGVLMAIGMRPKQLAVLVLLEGLVLGFFATIAGILLGLIPSWYLVTFGLDYSAFLGETFETEGLVLSTLFMGAWDPMRMAQYGAVSVAFTVFAAAYPAWFISQLGPLQAMRHNG